MRTVFLLYGVPAGVIVREGSRITLEYFPEYVSSPTATPLSTAMPLVSTRYGSKAVEAYLKGLLPDNPVVLERWARSANVKPGDTLGLIAAVGLDVSGGAIFVPESSLDDALWRRGVLTPVTEGQIAAELRRMRHDESAWTDEKVEHWSLAGAQSKFTLNQMPNGGWGKSEGSLASTHIVKPGILRIANQALVEHLSMRAFALSGLDVANTQYVHFEEQEAIVVERYDRFVGAGGDVRRIHQEDLVQAFSLDPIRKYESDGGPGAGRIADFLRTHGGDDDLAAFVRAVIANQILGAPDAHAKNYAILLAGREIKLAPLFDVATGLVPATDGKLIWTKSAMSIGGERRFGDVELRHWKKFATAVDFDFGQILEWVEQLAVNLPLGFEKALGEGQESERNWVAEFVLPLVRRLGEQTLVSLEKTRRVGGRLRTTFMEVLEEGGGNEQM